MAAGTLQRQLNTERRIRSWTTVPQTETNPTVLVFATVGGRR